MVLHMMLCIVGRKTGSPCNSALQGTQVAFLKCSQPDIVERHTILEHVSWGVMSLPAKPLVAGQP